MCSRTPWSCETSSGKTIPVKDAARFLKEILPAKPASEKEDTIKPKAKTDRKKGGKPKGRMSALDAAHEILTIEDRPMNVREITNLAVERGLWSPEGKTPSATLSAAIQRDLKKVDSRFTKTEKGRFAAR